MAATVTTTQVTCPADHAPCAGKCGGELVTATWKGSHVTLSPCSFVVAQGWRGNVAAVLWSDQMPGEAGVRHADGLVVFA